MYLISNKNTWEIKFSNESAQLEEETTLLHCEEIEWTDEAIRKIAAALSDGIERTLKEIAKVDEEIDALKERCGIEGTLLRLEWTDGDGSITRTLETP